MIWLVLALACAAHSSMAQSDEVVTPSDRRLPSKQFVFELPEPQWESSTNDEPPVVIDQFVEFESFDPQVWLQVGYLNWSLSKAPLSIPLATTGPASSGGVLGQPGTRTLLGPPNVALGNFSGFQFALGGWLNDEQVLGGELNFFYTEQRANKFAASNNGQGSDVLAVPYLNPANGQPTALVLAQPGVSSGSINFTDRAQLFAFDGTVLVNPSLQGGGNVARFDLLAGAQLVEFNEALQLTTSSTSAAGTAMSYDRYRTYTTFVGGLFGGRAAMRWRRWSASATAKVGVGENLAALAVGAQPDSTLYGRQQRPNVYSNWGFFARPGNLGYHNLNSFSVIPQARLNVGYSLRPGIKLIAGYDVLYWTSLLRAGNTIDPTPGHYQTTRTNVLLNGFNAGIEFAF